MSSRFVDSLTPMFVPGYPDLVFINCYGNRWQPTVDNVAELPDNLSIGDHLFGFREDFSNRIFDVLNEQAGIHGRRFNVIVDQIYTGQVRDHYPNLNLVFSLEFLERYGAIKRMPLRHEYSQHPDINFKNFLCSFNGSASIGRKLLPSIIQRFGWYNPEYVSKNTAWAVDEIDGALQDFVGDADAIYRKFFVGDDSEKFFAEVNSFGYSNLVHTQQVLKERQRHDLNITTLDHKITESFVHVVSETLPTSYLPFVTEKAFYSIVTRGLFVTYGQPGWYEYFTNCYGFRKYDKLFDYRFDTIKNPVHRLVELMCMISRYSKLSTFDWHDLYQQEMDNINFNYEHFFSGDYMHHIDNYSKTL